MRTGHCHHAWTEASQPLGEVFPSHHDRVRGFRVCRRCLRIEELRDEATVIELGSGPGTPRLPLRAERAA